MLGVKRAWKSVLASQTDDTLNGTNSTVPAAVPGSKIKVRSVVIVQGATASAGVTFNSKPAGSGVAVTGTFTPAAGGSVVLPDCDKGWFETNTGEGLTVTTGAGATAGISITYEVVVA